MTLQEVNQVLNNLSNTKFYKVSFLYK